MNAQVNQTAYTLLFAFGQAVGQAAGAVVKAKERLDAAKEKVSGPYDSAVLAAIECKTPESLEATYASLMDNIRQNRGGIATKMRAEKREEAGRNGETHKIPSSISTSKTVLLFAMRNGVPLQIDGKARTYGEIRDENQNVRDLAREKAETERMEKATGAEKALYDAQAAIAAMSSALPTFSESWLNDVAKYANNAVATVAKENADAEAAVKEAARKVASGAEGSGAELADALAGKRAAKRATRQQAAA